MTALNVLLNDLNTMLEDAKNPVITDDMRNLIRAILIFVMDNELVEMEKRQIIEAAMNFSNSKEEAEKYYAMTYGGEEI
jgi:hypothetical protein